MRRTQTACGVMGRFYPQALIAVGMVALATGILRAADSTAANPAIQSPAIQSWVQSKLKLAHDHPDKCQSRELTAFALAALIVRNDAATAEGLLHRAYNTQMMNPADQAYGQLRWLVGDTQPIKDFNAIEFNSSPLSCILLDFGDRLSPEFQRWFRPHLEASLAALQRHTVRTSYTNICIMNAVCLMMMGQAAHDSSAIREGQHRLDAWIAYTQVNGIHEFDSPVYYGVDLGSLVQGAKYVADPVYREKCRVILNYFWTDIAANYFAPRQQLAGPYSRDYEFLTGNGDMDDWLGAVGWSDFTPAPSLLLWLDGFNGKVYQPSEQLKTLAMSGPRTVVSAWDDNPGHQRYVWMGKSICIGSTSGSYEPQDKLFSVLFAARALPQVILVADTFDSPYGKVTRPDGTRHLKPFHEPPNLASVQDGPTALLTLDLDPSRIPADASGLATNFILPMEASLAINGKPVRLQAGDKLSVPADGVVTVSAGGAAAGFRLLSAEAVDGQSPVLTLLADEDGLKYGAVRLKLQHLPAGGHTHQQHLREAWLVTVAEGAQAVETCLGRLEKVQDQSQLDTQTWTTRVTIPGGTLEVARSAQDRTAIEAPRINGQPVKRSVLSVNECDLAQEIWKTLPQP